MGIDSSRIKLRNTTFKGVIPGIEACCTVTVTLKVVFESPENFQSENLIFDIVPFRYGYHALLGRTTFACFNAVPHYAYLKLEIPGPNGVITDTSNTGRTLRMKKQTLRSRGAGVRGGNSYSARERNTWLFEAQAEGTH